MFDNQLSRAGRACPASSLLLTACGVNMQETVNFRLLVTFMWDWEKTAATGSCKPAISTPACHGYQIAKCVRKAPANTQHVT